MLLGALLVATPVVSPLMRRQIGLKYVLAVAFFPWLGIIVQAKFFPYHYEGCLPFVCLLATAGYAALFARLRALGAPPAALAAGVGAVLYGLYDLGPYINPGSRMWDRVPLRIEALLHPSRRAALEDAMTSEGDVKSAENRRLTSWVVQTTPPDATLFVWGFEPVVYDASMRRPASRYIYDVPQRVAWSRGPACARLEQDLRAHPPAAVAVEKDDWFVDVTGNLLDSAESLGSCGWFPGWLAAGYRKAWSSDKFDAYESASRPRGDVTAGDGPREP